MRCQWRSKGSEEDQSYAKISHGVKMSKDLGSTKVLGVLWDVSRDKLLFDIGEVTEAMKPLEPTKRNFVSITAKFFNPLVSCHGTIQDVLSAAL